MIYRMNACARQRLTVARVYLAMAYHTSARDRSKSVRYMWQASFQKKTRRQLLHLRICTPCVDLRRMRLQKAVAHPLSAEEWGVVHFGCACLQPTADGGSESEARQQVSARGTWWRGNELSPAVARRHAPWVCSACDLNAGYRAGVGSRGLASPYLLEQWQALVRLATRVAAAMSRVHSSVRPTAPPRQQLVKRYPHTQKK